MATPQQIVANKQNAQSSTGPKTEAGQQRSSLNSVTHGLTGQTIVLAAEEAEPYRLFTEGFLSDLAPKGLQEVALVYAIIGTRWRMNQIAVTEAAIYAMGHRENASKFENETPEMAAAMSRALVFEEKRQNLDRLHRYESRMNRQVNKDMAELTQLQTARKAKEAQQQNDAIALLTHFTTTGKSWNPADFGFVWSIEEIQLLEERQFLRNRVCKAATA
jgi:hypothetical protein